MPRQRSGRKKSAYEELLQFTAESRDRISDTGANNRFGMRASGLAEERATLDIIVSRYEAVSERFMHNTKAILGSAQPGNHPLTDAQRKFFTEGVPIQRELRLDFRSFYLIAKIFLDKSARLVEFYFGKARGLSLDNHHKLTTNLAGFCSDKGLRLPQNMLPVAHDLRDRISDYRDKQVSHDKSATPPGIAFSLGARGAVRLVRVNVLTAPSTTAGLESEEPQDLTKALDEYLLLVVQLLRENEAKSSLPIGSAGPSRGTRRRGKGQEKPKP